MRVVLGTDACAVSRFLDMVRVMYLGACAHKDVKTDPTVIGAHKAMEMATIDAAEALLWHEDIGSLEVGKLADIVIADTDGIEWQPVSIAQSGGEFGLLRRRRLRPHGRHRRSDRNGGPALHVRKRKRLHRTGKPSFHRHSGQAWHWPAHGLAGLVKST